ncbi:photosynthetic complex assembly protein PuhC [Rhodoplanes azumiensis]|uniref:Photosynthetic complex assembly protein PuhC n=1 Tax=Rhodoplanes azumiensis TaxID=1897628 RepID=A0ABW5AND8_9BRAD
MGEVRGRPFPRGPLLGAAALVGFSLFAAAFLRDPVDPSKASTNVTAVASRDLRFEDQSDGSVVVFDAEKAVLVDVLPPASNGFVRATLRGFARDHKLQETGGDKRQVEGPKPPFRLILWSDGRLSLQDLMTLRSTELTAFGQTNVEAFARLLPSRTAAP